jgi:hypothetical protein
VSEHAVDQEQRWKAVRAHIAKGDQAKVKAEQHYIAAGQHLAALKAEHTGTWAEWEVLVKEKAGIGKSRASELMQIADGSKTVEGIREATAEKVRQIRARKSSPVRTGENSGNVTASTDTKGVSAGLHLHHVPSSAEKSTATVAPPPVEPVASDMPSSEADHPFPETEKPAELAPALVALVGEEQSASAPDEELALLRAFATFILTSNAKVSVALGPDLVEWRTLRAKTKEMLGITS